jgi:hypothetical protein
MKKRGSGVAQKAKVRHYRRLNGKFLRDAQELLRSGDVVQASEKFWGAAAEIVKAYAASRGLRTRTHGALWQVVIDLDQKHPSLSLLRDFNQAGYLHSNFYEDELRPEAVRVAGDVVREFVAKIGALMEPE